MLQTQNAMLHFLCILTRPRISIQGVPLVPTTQSDHKNDKGGRIVRRPRTDHLSLSLACVLSSPWRSLSATLSRVLLISVAFAPGISHSLSAKRLLCLSVTACLRHLKGNLDFVNFLPSGGSSFHNGTYVMLADCVDWKFQWECGELSEKTSVRKPFPKTLLTKPHVTVLNSKVKVLDPKHLIYEI